jgi:hypothetical protein
MIRQIIATLILATLGLIHTRTATAQTTPNTFREGDTVCQTGLHPNSTVGLGSSQVAKTLFSDSCGLLRINLGPTFSSNLKVNNTTIDQTSNLTYKCLNGTPKYGSGIPAPTNYQTTGKNITLHLIPTNTNGANKANFVSYNAPLTKTYKANACGVIAIKKPLVPFTTTSTLSIANGTYSTPIYTFGDLPTGTAPVTRLLKRHHLRCQLSHPHPKRRKPFPHRHHHLPSGPAQKYSGHRAAHGSHQQTLRPIRNQRRSMRRFHHPQHPAHRWRSDDRGKQLRFSERPDCPGHCRLHRSRVEQ